MTINNEIFIPNIFQSEALQEIDKSITVGDKKFLVVMPTGTGKTFLAAQWFKTQLQTFPKSKLLFICHNQDILIQANDKEFANCLSELNISCGYYNATEKNIKQVTFATVQTLYRNLTKIPSDYFDYIIVDEAHHYRAKTFEKAITHFSPKLLMGLTATPIRTDDKSILKIFDKIIYEAKISDGIKKGLLSKIKYYCVDNDIDFSDLHWNGNNYNEKDLNKKLCVKEYDDAILKEYNDTIKISHNKHKTIAFCATVEHAIRMEKLFNDNNIKAVSLTAKYFNSSNKEITISDSKREKTIAGYKNGDYDIIFVRDLFNEGVDIPDADSIMMLRPTQSNTIFTQQIGRGLRVSPDKNYLLVLDFTGNCHRCDVNYQVLSEILETNIIQEVKNRLSSEKESERNFDKLTILSLDCEVHLNKTKINIIKEDLNKVNTHFQPTKQMLIEEYFRIKKIKGSRLISSDLLKYNSLYSDYDYKKEFGSWNNFLTYIHEKIEITRKALEDNFFNLEKSLGRKPMGNDFYNNLSKFTLYDYKKEYGSWPNFLKSINYERVKEYSKEELYTFFYELMNESGKVPRLQEIITKYKIPQKAFDKTFGSFSKFLKINKIKRNQTKKIKNNFPIIIEDYTPINPIPENALSHTLTNSHSHKRDLSCMSGHKYTNSQHKNFMRSKVISKITPGDTILMLESPELNAIKEIEIQKVRPKKIIIPNNFEFDALARSLESYSTDLYIEVINTSALQYIVDHPEEHFDFMWLDYCGAFSYYTRDLDVVLSRKIKEMKLILTYNVTDLAKQDDSYYFTNVISYVLEKLRGKNEILLLQDVSQRYKKAMYSVGFDIKQQV